MKPSMMQQQYYPQISKPRWDDNYLAMDTLVHNVMDDMDHFILNDSHRDTSSSSGSASPVYMYNTSSVAPSTMGLSMAASPSLAASHSLASPSLAKITVFQPSNMDRMQLRHHIFISKDCSQQLARYVVQEQWGKDAVLLYKYLDYMFRCQVFDKQAIQIDVPTQNLHYLIFQTGLQRRSDHSFLFMVLTPNSNTGPRNSQKWSGPHPNDLANWFLSQDQVMYMLRQRDIALDRALPRRSVCSARLSSDLLHDNSCSIQVNWEERLSTNADRIMRVIGARAFVDRTNKTLKIQELRYAFGAALAKTRRVAELNPRLAVPQCFVDTKHCKYRMELLLPLFVEFPAKQGMFYKFALAIGKSTEQRGSYIVKSILTLDMAYSNARLAGYVDSMWLCYGGPRSGSNHLW